MLKSEIEEVETTVWRKKLPLLPMSAVAGWSGVEELGVRCSDCQWVELPDILDFGADFLIRANGDSMSPTYCSGDILACKSIRELNFFQWGKVYVIDSSQGVMVKRLEQSDDEESILCVSDNPRFRPFSLRKDEIRSISLVVGLFRAE
jgi:phage repressor protein C with HTH and peptisase S24 domain